MTQDLFVSVSVEERELMSAPIPKGASWGVDWHKLNQLWLAALMDRSIPARGWALFMSVDADHPKFVTGRRDFDVFLLDKGQHPVWSPRCTYYSALNSGECPGWAEFSTELDAFFREQPNDLPFGFKDEVEYFVDCMVNRIALETMQKVNWRPSISVGSHFLSPNTGQDLILHPLHPSGGQLFAATRGSTYEEAINFSTLHSQEVMVRNSAAD